MNKTLINHLRGLGTGEIAPVRGGTRGICCELNHLMGEGVITYSEKRVVHCLMTLWPEYSGSADYPVLTPRFSSARAAFRFTSDKWEGTYGAARKRLCLWLADQLEKDDG